LTIATYPKTANNILNITIANNERGSFKVRAHLMSGLGANTYFFSLHDVQENNTRGFWSLLFRSAALCPRPVKGSISQNADNLQSGLDSKCLCDSASKLNSFTVMLNSS
jgi:hypothetical protein